MLINATVESVKPQISIYWKIVQHMQNKVNYAGLHPLHLRTSSMKMSKAHVVCCLL